MYVHYLCKICSHDRCKNNIIRIRIITVIKLVDLFICILIPFVFCAGSRAAKASLQKNERNKTYNEETGVFHNRSHFNDCGLIRPTCNCVIVTVVKY